MFAISSEDDLQIPSAVEGGDNSSLERLNGALGCAFMVVVLLVILLSPILAVCDVVIHHRTMTGYPDDRSEVPTIFRSAHSFYAGAIIVLVLPLAALAVCENLSERKAGHAKKANVGLACIVICILLYIMPMCWFVYSVPGYGKGVLKPAAETNERVGRYSPFLHHCSGKTSWRADAAAELGDAGGRAEALVFRNCVIRRERRLLLEALLHRRRTPLIAGPLGRAESTARSGIELVRANPEPNATSSSHSSICSHTSC